MSRNGKMNKRKNRRAKQKATHDAAKQANSIPATSVIRTPEVFDAYTKYLMDASVSSVRTDLQKFIRNIGEVRRYDIKAILDPEVTTYVILQNLEHVMMIRMLMEQTETLGYNVIRVIATDNYVCNYFILDYAGEPCNDLESLYDEGDTIEIHHLTRRASKKFFSDMGYHAEVESIEKARQNRKKLENRKHRNQSKIYNADRT